MKKIFKIFLSTTLALTVVILGVGYVFYYKYLDQVTLQHDNEQISKFKRSLDYSSFDIDDFSNRYQELEPALAYANIEAIQSGISAGDYSCQEVVQFYVYRSIRPHIIFEVFHPTAINQITTGTPYSSLKGWWAIITLQA